MLTTLPIETVHNFSFPRSRRLHGDKIISQVRKTGHRKFSTHLSLHYLPDERCFQVGFAVSKRCGNAVVRNRIKRLLREYVRHRFSELPQQGCCLLGAHKAFSSMTPDILAELQQLFHRIQRTIVKTKI
ncbi:MAG: ribonuclease P protein component [bacterium]|nr:ribonuclease P protein component [bacterium]